MGDSGVAGMFPPNDYCCAAIHDEVGPLVDELDAVEGRLRKEGNE